MAFDVNTTWLGIGEKTGGMLFVVGFEGMEGKVWHMGTSSLSYSMSVTAPKVGVGLGGGAGLVAVCIFNCDNPLVRLNNTNLNDWGVNISLGGKWKAVAKALMKAGFYARLAKIGARAGKLKNVDDLRNDLHYIYNTLDIAASDSSPKVVVFDMPVGYGLELSASYNFGKLEIY